MIAQEWSAKRDPLTNLTLAANEMAREITELRKRPVEQYSGELDNLRSLLKAVCLLSDGRPDDMPLTELVIDHYSDSRMVDALAVERGEIR